MTSVHPLWHRARLALGISLATTFAGPALGVSFNIGEIEGQFDSSLSIDSFWSTASTNRNLIGVNNGGKGLAQISDDGRLNFKRGETFSKIFSGTHDLELKHGDTGFFVRGKYWYDFELKDESRPFKPVSDKHREEAAKSSGAQILDAFVYYNYAIAEQPGSARLGKQVVNWGESRFMGGGINVINPLDVSALRRPGSLLEDARVPVNLFYLSQNLTDNVSAEAFYQLEWDSTVSDNCGTFFSQSDMVTQGCDSNLRVLDKRSTLAPQSLAALAENAVEINEEGVLVRRGADRDPRNSGQFGLALHAVIEPLDTEFGGYFMNYHSRSPILGGRAAGPSVYAAAQASGAMAPLIVVGNSGYFMQYPEDIHLYGLSFSTTLSTGSAWRGELSYRPNAPIALNINDVLNAQVTPLSGYADASPLGGAPGQDLQGYRRKEVTQFQTSLTHIFDQAMGASRLTLMAELGVTHVGGLESRASARYGRDPVFGSGELPGAICAELNSSILDGAGSGTSSRNASRYCNQQGFTTSTSWGYRARAVWEYNNVLPGINLKPNLAWAHDVSGYSPGPDANFEEGRKALSLGIDADYQDVYTSSLSYTNFFGGRYSTLDDRDFVTLSVGVHF